MRYLLHQYEDKKRKLNEVGRQAVEKKVLLYMKRRSLRVGAWMNERKEHFKTKWGFG